jgi:hypothetical protein
MSCQLNLTSERLGFGGLQRRDGTEGFTFVARKCNVRCSKDLPIDCGCRESLMEHIRNCAALISFGRQVRRSVL